MAPPYHEELPWKTWWQGEHLDLVEHKKMIEGWEGWALYPNDDIVTWPSIVAVKDQHPPTQNPPPVKGLF